MFDGDDQDYYNQSDDDYMEQLRAFYEECDKLEMDEPELTPEQLTKLRNDWEKHYQKAKTLVWAFEFGEWGLKLVHVENIDFEI
jgi:hypothetical protein